MGRVKVHFTAIYIERRQKDDHTNVLVGMSTKVLVLRM